MDGKLKRRIAIGAAGLAAVTGGGVAVAAATKNDERDAYLSDVAGRLNVTPDKLTDALKGAWEDRLDAAVKAGKLTQAQADAMKKKLEDSGEVPFGPGFGGPGGPRGGGGPGGPGGGPGFGRHGGPGGPGASLDTAAKFLGLTAAELRTQLEAGKSLADVAKDKGKAEDDLVAALVADEKAELDKAVTDKKLTAAQRDKIVADLPARVKAMVEGKPGKGPRGGPGPGPGGRGPWDGPKKGSKDKSGEYPGDPGAAAPGTTTAPETSPS